MTDSTETIAPMINELTSPSINRRSWNMPSFGSVEPKNQSSVNHSKAVLETANC